MPFTLSAREVVGRPISVPQGAAVVKQPAFRRADIGIRQHIRQTRRQTDAFQRGGEIGFAEVLVDHVFSALRAQLSSQVAQRPGVITRQFVNLPFMAFTGDNAGGSGGIIRAGGGGNLPSPAAPINTPCSSAGGALAR